MAEDELQATRIRAGDKRVLIACGFAMIFLAAGATLLPLVTYVPGAALVGGLLLIAGVTELVAARSSPIKGMSEAWRIAGAVTILAGLLFVLNPFSKLVPLSTIVMAWLFLRSFILLAAAWRVRASRKIWILSSGTADLLLALMLLVGLPVATLVTSLFGATVELVAGFALILAASFVVTGGAFLDTAGAAPGGPDEKDPADVA